MPTAIASREPGDGSDKRDGLSDWMAEGFGKKLGEDLAVFTKWAVVGVVVGLAILIRSKGSLRRALVRIKEFAVNAIRFGRKEAISELFDVNSETGSASENSQHSDGKEEGKNGR